MFKKDGELYRTRVVGVTDEQSALLMESLENRNFYGEDPDSWKLWAKYGVLAVEMESAALYTLAARFGVEALTMLTVSDDLVTGEATSSEERERTFTDMMKLALETAARL